MKKILAVGLFLFFMLLAVNTSSFATPMFDIYVISSVSDLYDYEYNLYYGSDGSQRAISHWWLELNCGHLSIDEESIYGYTVIGDTTYNWDFEFGIVSPSSVGGYTDWVIKWNAEQTNPDGSKTSIEPPKGEDFLIGTFGFHSSMPERDGWWGAKDGRNGAIEYWDDGTTKVPRCIPEPTSLLLFGIGVSGFSVIKRRKR